MSRHAFNAFVFDRLVLDEKLVCPIRTVWQDYQSYCTAWGFVPSEVTEFVSWLLCLDGVLVKDRKGPGRLRRVANGLGIRPGDIALCRMGS